MNRNHKALAQRLLTLIETEGRTYASGAEIVNRLEKAVSRSNSKGDLRRQPGNDSLDGLIEAKVALMLPLMILSEMAEGVSESDLRKDFPRFETSLPEGWDRCVLALREVAGEIPSTLQERDRARWVGHWRGLWASNRRNEAEGKFYPGNTATDEAILKTARSFYPDLDLREITGEVSEPKLEP